MATLHKAIDPAKAQDPNLVKLVHDQSGRALYFSRALIPGIGKNTMSDFG